MSRVTACAAPRMEAEVAAVLARGIDSVEGLAALLGDSSASSLERATGCWLLGRLEDPSAVGALRLAARDSESQVRAEAVRALGELGSEAEDVLIAALVEDTDEVVRQMAAQALGMLGGERALAVLVETLRRTEEGEEVRSACAEALGDTFEPEAVPPLLEALNDPSALVRYDAALALGQLGDVRALDKLSSMAEHDTGEIVGVGTVREMASDALATIEARR
jgi:HEAT repeat protein